MTAQKAASDQVAHLRLLAETYDGVDAEDWAQAADTIERLLLIVSSALDHCKRGRFIATEQVLDAALAAFTRDSEWIEVRGLGEIKISPRRIVNDP